MSTPIVSATAPEPPRAMTTSEAGHTLFASFLGWALDAFDFFVVVFLISELMGKFHVGKAAIVWSMTLTLATRPIGALFFGALADRFGRKKPLIACVLYFSTVTVLSGLAPTYWIFMAMRLLYGLGMGGYWGIGASYAMESAPRHRRGVLSGLMQGGYPFGYLMAAIGMQTIAPRFGWQTMFFVGVGVTVVIVLLAAVAPESAAWRLHRTPSLGKIFGTLFQHLGVFGYLLLLMAAITTSHTKRGSRSFKFSCVMRSERVSRLAANSMGSTWP